MIYPKFSLSNIKLFFNALRNEPILAVCRNTMNYLLNFNQSKSLQKQIETEQIQVTDYEFIIVNENINTQYYKSNYLINEDITLHYCNTGWRMGFNPNQNFNTEQYLNSNEDVKMAGINPFYHYLTEGYKEDREIGSNTIDELRSRVMNYSGVHLSDLNWRNRRAIPTTIAYLVKRRLKDKQIVVSFSHDNYIENIGGIQLCINKEAEESMKRGMSYLHISPFNPKLSIQNDWGYVVLTLDGVDIGVISEDCLNVIFENNSNNTLFVFHSVLGFSKYFLQKFMKTKRRYVFWIHDFLLLCPNFFMLRNSIEYCNNPPIDSQKCGNCIDGKLRIDHIALLEKLFFENRFNITFVSPSDFAAKTFLNLYDNFNFEYRVLPHVSLKLESQDLLKINNRKPKIAFVGATEFHKGWDLYDIFINKCYDLSLDFEFYLFTSLKPHKLRRDIKYRNINLVNKPLNKSLAENNIDIMISFSRCAETFGFTFYEAISGGCFVLNFSKYGNIYNEICDNPEWGQNTTLERFLAEDKNIVDTLRNFKTLILCNKKYYQINYSNMTLDLL